MVKSVRCCYCYCSVNNGTFRYQVELCKKLRAKLTRYCLRLLIDSIFCSSADKEEAKESEKPEGVENKPKGNRSRQRKDNIEDENKNKTENEKNLGVGDNKEGDTTETVSLSKEEEEELARVRKEEKRKKEQEYLEVLRRAAAASSLQPLGRDRLFRRYWAFHSLKGLFVEDDDPYLPLFLQSKQDDEEVK